jgi:soluble lytic murein transglycosylase-like protein
LRVLCLLVLVPAVVWAGQQPSESIGRLLSAPIPQSITFCGETVPLHREDVLERLDLEVMDTLANSMRTALWFKRLPRHLPSIEAALAQRKLPQDLKYLAVIESNLRDDAVSAAGAVGPWQFMGGTGAFYGLEKTDWKDDARDWQASTAAALSHLAELREALGSWATALAAYNSGQGRVSRAMETQGEKDFYGLKLPRETERYVFRAIAAKLIMENPGAYGIQLDSAHLYFPEETATVELRINRVQVPVAALAHAGGASYRWFLRLNPWIVGSALPRGTHRVRVPQQGAATVQAALARWEAENREPQTLRHKVRAGDTLATIARQYGVSVEELRSWNRLGARGSPKRGQEVVIHVID